MPVDPLSIGLGASQRGFGAGNIRAIAEQSLQELLRTPAGARQHALLGDVRFDLITYFEGQETHFGSSYAEHALLDGKPRLQSTGDKLDEITWQLVFHTGFCDPEAEYQKLRRLVAARQAKPLHLANGDYKGHFIAVEARVSTRQTTRDGAALWLAASLSLREYAEPLVSVEEKARQKPVAVVRPAAGGTLQKPPRTVRKSPGARSPGAPATRQPPLTG